MEDKDFTRFVQQVKDYTKIDLNLYKEAQMKRRLTSLRMKRGYASFAAYFDAMVQDQALLAEFLDRMTINVSEFWRNPNRWEVLASTFLPELAASNRNLRIWSAACSTGEEPNTIAMILAEQHLLHYTYILASDLDEGALAKAQAGVYPERSVKDVPPVYKEKYFTKQGNFYQVKEDLKKRITYRKHNLLLDRFEGSFDLIVCRNVLIYFTEEAKHILYERFAQSLRPGGILFVGSTEQIFNAAQYGLEAAETFFYRKV